MAVVCLGHAPLDAHARPHAAHQVVVPHRQRRLARREVRVEVVDDAGQTRARGQQAQVPHGGQTVPRVPRFQTVVPEIKAWNYLKVYLGLEYCIALHYVSNT